MTTKREERKQRSEATRLELERRKRAQGVRSRVLMVVGVLAVAGAVILGATRRRDAGRVWSAEHGHWHDR
jgi:hypothetical protein